MKGDLCFVKFDKEVARAELPGLINKVKDHYPYYKYIQKNEHKYDCRLDLELINVKIKENVELLAVDELRSIIDWSVHRKIFRAKRERDYYLDGPPIGKLNRYGLDIFLCIGDRQVSGFDSLLDDFMVLTNQNIEYKSDADELKMFCKYATCYCGEMKRFIDDHYYKKDEDHRDHLWTQRYISEIDLAYGEYYHQLALKEIESFRKYHLETVELTRELAEFRRAQRGIHYSIPLELSKYLMRERKLLDDGILLYSILDLRVQLKDYEGRVTRVHYDRSPYIY